MERNNPVIVAIDDNRDNLVTLKAFITDALPDARVFTAHNGKKGIELAREHDPDVILLDIVMPVMDGFEVCQMLKHDPTLHYIPVVFLTALKGDRASRIRALEVGGEAFITKPFDEAELTAQIRAMAKIKAANEREQDERKYLARLVAERTDQLEQELEERKKTEQELSKVNTSLEKSKTAMLNLLEDLKEEVEARKKSEEEYRSLFKSMREGFAYCRMLYDEKWRPTDFILLNVNPAFDRILGTTTVTGKRITEVFPRIKEAFPEVFEIYGRVALTGEPESFDLDFVPSKKWLHISIYSPAKEHFVAIFEDITDSKRAEEALRESEKRLRLALSIAHMGYWKYDVASGTLAEYEKHGALFGAPTDGLMRTLADVQPLVHPDDRAFAEMALRRTVAEGVPFDSTYRTVLPNGETHWLHSFGHLYRNSSGKPDHVFGVTQDITERKQAEETIALTTRKLTLMNDVTYQYIQNKVTALRGYAELSKDAKTDAERLSFIEKEEHVLADIHQLIKNTRQYQEIGLLQPQWIPVEQSIRIASSLVSPKQEISIETALHGLELYSDPLIEKIIANLIENAVIHGKTTRHITFSCKEMVDGLILICEDDGVGISPKDKARLFDRLVGEKIRFGLFFVRECLLLSGMTIAETGEPGKGARFEITVPKGVYRVNPNTGDRHRGEI